MWPFSPRPEGLVRASGQSSHVSPKRRSIRLRLVAPTVLAALIAAAVATIAFGLDLDGDARAARGAASARTAAASTSAASVASTSGASSTSGACGAATAQTVAAVQSAVARRIYAQEAGGASTRLDAARVASFQPLLRALASGGPAAVRTAVHELVYMPGWHIVRLRVVRGGRVLADIGGPYILAPVHGTLRAHGRVLASYVMSVQDDLGYVKLVTRFIGAPIDLFWNGSRVMGTGSAAAAHGDPSSTLSLGAFPAGRLDARLYVAQGPVGSELRGRADRRMGLGGAARRGALSPPRAAPARSRRRREDRHRRAPVRARRRAPARRRRTGAAAAVRQRPLRRTALGRLLVAAAAERARVPARPVLDHA